MKGSASAARGGACRHMRSVGKFFYLHPGPLRVARDDLGWDLAKLPCRIPGFAPPLDASRPPVWG